MDVSYDFTGKAVVVTGAARGVGRAIVAAFARAGASVIAADRDADGLAGTCRGWNAADRGGRDAAGAGLDTGGRDAAAADRGGRDAAGAGLGTGGRDAAGAVRGGRVEAVVADIRDADGAALITGAAAERFGRLDICVNNAAVAPHTSLLDERVETWDTVYAVNCRGTFLMTQAAARIMIGQGDGGRIVNFSSGVSSRGSAGAAACASSRAATESFTRVAAIELAPHGILVNCVSPGLIDTQPKPLPPAMAESLGARIPALPLARPGEAGEVASLVLWLSSSAASYVTGSVYQVDGGAGVGSRAGHPIVDDDVRYDWVTGRQRA